MRLISGTGFLYPLLNLVAAGCVLIDLQRHFNLSSFLIQVSWIAISLAGLARVSYQCRRISLTSEEESFAASKLPTAPRYLVRRLLDAGRWVDLPEGWVLARRGLPFDNLVYVVRGSVACGLEGEPRYVYGADRYLGELTVLSGEPASATCVTASPCRCLLVDADRLRKLAAMDERLRVALEASFFEDVYRKMIEADDTVSTLICELAEARRSSAPRLTLIKSV
ncbi:Crp/Fnr family transcriptional regulator [Litorisediminicola beolgyonensis]|uniref:Crp/Fnr family transcriptional regulator n=2 Tax=Litorisediminicola beolgyonensis TaxID=1173614 RepID=A0ABW3ZE72_9RHOB